MRYIVLHDYGDEAYEYAVGWCEFRRICRGLRDSCRVYRSDGGLEADD